MPLTTEPLIEFKEPVVLPFRNGFVTAQRDVHSGYVFFQPPPPEELSAYYQSEYAKKQVGYYTVDTDYNPGKNGYHASRILDLYRTLQNREPRSAFELGCAYGGLVFEMARRGIEARGSDINRMAIAEGRRVKGNDRIVHARNIDAFEVIRKPVDLIYSVHTLEHDERLIDVIGKCRRALTDDGGLLFVGVPNAMYVNAMLEGFRHNYWAAYPEHLHMLSAGFLPELCREAGFVPVFYETRIFFDVDVQLTNQFNSSKLTEPKRAIWEMILGTAGHGMELNFMLTPIGSQTAIRLAARIRQVQDALEVVRQREVAVRAFLKDALR